MTLAVSSCRWDPSKRIIAFGANTSLLSEKKLTKLLNNHSHFWDGKIERTVDTFKDAISDKIKLKIINKDDWNVT